MMSRPEESAVSSRTEMRSGLKMVLALGGLLAFATPSAAATGAAAVESENLQALLRELRGATTGVSQSDARESHGEFLRRLSEVRSAVEGCDAFVDRYGSNDRVARILKGLREKPGRRLFTSPEIVDDLERAVGTPIDLSQLDIELCVQVRDRQIGVAHGAVEPVTFAALGVSLRKCLSTLNAIGPNAAGTAVLQRLGRRVGDERFTSPARLAALEQAIGRDTRLTSGEFETCVDAYDVHASLENTFVGDNPPPCTSGEEFCSGISGTICCSAGEVCVSSCVRSVCNAGCEAQWCFPGDATVRTESGTAKAMRDVRLGDRLQVALPDGSVGYEDVYLNTHQDGTASAPYVTLTLASGRTLTLSPRHFIPVAASADGGWDARVDKGADEVRPGDFVWSQKVDGRMSLDEVDTVGTKVAVGAYNPLTMNGTIVVDGVVASAHSDWFLDGIVSADTQVDVYQAILTPVRLAYRAIGPARMEAITEGSGVVDFVREATTPNRVGGGSAWIWAGLALTVAFGAVLLRRRRPAGH